MAAHRTNPAADQALTPEAWHMHDLIMIRVYRDFGITPISIAGALSAAGCSAAP